MGWCLVALRKTVTPVAQPQVPQPLAESYCQDTAAVARPLVSRLTDPVAWPSPANVCSAYEGPA